MAEKKETGEYQYSEGVGEDVFGSGGGAPGGKPGVAQHVITLFVMCLIGFGAYKLYHLYAPKKRDTQAPLQITRVTKPTQEGLAVPKKITPAVAVKPVEPIEPLPPHHRFVETHLKTLVDHTTNHRSQLQTLQGNVVDLQNNLSNVSGQLSTLTNQLEALQTAMTSQKEQLAEINQKLTKPKKPRRVTRHRPMKPRTRYFVQAMIPGRAWLMSSSGATITVSKGSKLAGYGFIRKIDPQRGTVMTSSGYTLRYQENGS